VTFEGHLVDLFTRVGRYPLCRYRYNIDISDANIGDVAIDHHHHHHHHHQITVFIVRGLQDWPMAHYNCSYGVKMHVKIEKNKIK